MVRFDPHKDNIFCWRFFGCGLDKRCLYSTLGCFFGCTGVILFIVLLATSIKDVDENEYAIPTYKVSREIGEPLGPGKHTLKPDVKLTTYDALFITNELKIPCISEDGLEIKLKVAQQYQIKKDNLIDVFNEFGDQSDLDTYIDTIAQDSIRDTCARFTGEQFFAQRGDVEIMMIQNITADVESARSHVVPGFVQLKNIDLPSALLESIENKQLALEDVDVANRERTQALIEEQTRLGEAELDARILLVDATARGDVIKVAATEKANARLIQWAERAKAFIIDLDALGIDSVSYVDHYLYPRANARTLTPVQQACLARCPPDTACWYCFTTADAAVAVESVVPPTDTVEPTV